jgi:hypothetical protein
MLIHAFTRIEGNGQGDGGNLRTLETEVLRMVCMVGTLCK